MKLNVTTAEGDVLDVIALDEIGDIGQPFAQAEVVRLLQRCQRMEAQDRERSAEFRATVDADETA